MSHFELDERLTQACIHLGMLGQCHLLLMNNAALPWFILVPETSATELCDLEADLHKQLFAAAAKVSRVIQKRYTIDKLNVASLGNIVQQMHLHVIGRRRDDYCWPGGVWGPPHDQPYTEAAVSDIRAWVATDLGVTEQPA